MSDAVITVENLSKAYRIGLKEEIPDTLVGALTSWAKAPLRNFHRLRKLDVTSQAAASEQKDGPGDSIWQDDIIWALRGVSFDVRHGEVVGIVGRNGAGKSTLLKILSRITEPTSGRARICGRVSSLLEVGTGFHPELTGRENIYMNGTILGMTKREIDRKFDEIVSFSGVEKFLDTPTKRYSSGMQVRLAFAVAAHLEPEILIIDEVLAVGDAAFQKKCLGKMQDVARGGRTVLFVSHNMAAVRNLCSVGIWIDGGVVREIADVDQVVASYLGGCQPTQSAESSLAGRTDRQGDGSFRFTDFRIVDAQGNEVTTITSGDEITLLVSYESKGDWDPRDAIIAIEFNDHYDSRVAFFSSEEIRPPFGPFRSQGCIRVNIPEFLIRAGDYHVLLWASRFNTSNEHLGDCVRNVARIHVLSGDFWNSGAKNKPGSYCLMRASMSNGPSGRPLAAALSPSSTVPDSAAKLRD